MIKKIKRNFISTRIYFISIKILKNFLISFQEINLKNHVSNLHPKKNYQFNKKLNYENKERNFSFEKLKNKLIKEKNTFSVLQHLND